ncbi:MAG: hypothetical protein A3K19_27250 [Lentisphaerae bacterium RIFOXYB12_FULL_65_16]|nr:MAG: hypothetical protein A3K18_16025 [Lentisphaerae bacterium RIFOXYA12_64_32]OGV86387.1 MAG: hypothetical protein A3K19_27250 [Lentisphaerae bacterium RIFOXYB12_FULL_65_16]
MDKEERMAAKQTRRFSVCQLCLLVCLGGWPAVAAEFPAADVLLKSELELYGVTAGLTAMTLAGASGGTAMALSDSALATRRAWTWAPSSAT